MLGDVLAKCGEFGIPLLVLSFAVVAIAVTHVVAVIRGRGDAAAWRRQLQPLGEIAQMLGLTGSVIGFLQLFESFDGRLRPDAVISGMGKAYYTTAYGLVIALVAFIAVYLLDRTARTRGEDSEV